MNAHAIHTCSYQCERPECIRAQRDELAAKQGFTAADMADQYATAFERGRESVLAELHAAAQEAVAYLDIGAGGYLDIGSDLPDERLLSLPKGRHALGIIGTYGIDGYVTAPVTAAPDMVRTEIQRALSELDRVQTAEDHTSDCIGCAENALHRALEAIAAALRAAPEVTPEMVAAAEEAYMPFGDMELALNCALAARPQEASDA